MPHISRYYLSLCCTALIFYLSFFTPPKLPTPGPPGWDKLVHSVMYGGLCCTLWFEYFRNRDMRYDVRRRFFPRWVHTPVDWRRCLLWAFVVPIVLGGVIELLQAYCTGGRRSGDWWDFAADALGVVVVWAIVRRFNKAD